MMSVPMSASSGSIDTSVSAISGIIVVAMSFSLTMLFFKPSVMLSKPAISFSSASSLPVSRPVNPSMSCDSPGKNSAVIPRFTPSIAVVMSCRLSLNNAEAFTASSLITPPSSFTRSIIACVSSDDVLSSAPISIAPRPRSVEANAVLSVLSPMSCSRVIVCLNKSSADILPTSSMLIPSFSNAATCSSVRFCEALASVLNVAVMLSILVPECCITASHS